MTQILKNISTIFEKVRRGELPRSGGSSIFPSFKYAAKAELIEPYLHFIDEKALNRSVDNFVRTNRSTNIEAIAKNLNKKLVNPDNLDKEMIQIWQNFPKEVVNDIFNVFYHDMQDLKFKDRSNGNKFRYQMIEKSADPTARVLTKESSVKSMIFTRAMVQYYLAMMAMLQQEDPEKFEQMMEQLKKPEEGKGEGQDGEKNDPGTKSTKKDEQKQKGNEQGPGESDDADGEGASQDGQGQDGQGSEENNEQDSSQEGKNKQDSPSNVPAGNPPPASSGQSGSGDTEQSSAQKLMDELTQRFDQSAAGKRILDNLMQSAKQSAENIDKLMDKEELSNLWKDLSSKGAEAEKAVLKTDEQWLSQMDIELRNIGFSMSGLKQKIQHLLDKSISHFSAKEIPYYENIFEADSLGGLEDYLLLHPKLRQILIEDIQIKETKKMGKIDIYIDVSGSMSSSCGVEDRMGRSVSKAMFAKSLVYKMKEQNLLNEVYQFENKVTYVGKTVLDILTIGGGGGTNLNAVILNVEMQKKNAIILTDAEDHCNQYSPYAFFIGVAGAKFNSFSPQILKKYYDGGQMLVFDGRRTYPVDEYGRILT